MITYSFIFGIAVKWKNKNIIVLHSRVLYIYKSIEGKSVRKFTTCRTKNSLVPHDYSTNRTKIQKILFAILHRNMTYNIPDGNPDCVSQA